MLLLVALPSTTTATPLLAWADPSSFAIAWSYIPGEAPGLTGLVQADFLGAVCPDGARAETWDDGYDILGTCAGHLTRQ